MARSSVLHRLARNERGAALVEFAMVLPILLLLFSVTIEGTRLMWSYQITVAGVRDATRYLGRVVPSDICAPGKSFPNRNAQIEAIVRDRFGVTGTSVLPSGVTLSSVTSSLTCVTGTYRVSPAPVAVVTATITIEFPFAGIIAYAGGSLGTITTTITDRSRVFGS